MVNRKKILAFCLSAAMVFQSAVPSVMAAEIPDEIETENEQGTDLLEEDDSEIQNESETDHSAEDRTETEIETQADDITNISETDTSEDESVISETETSQEEIETEQEIAINEISDLQNGEQYKIEYVLYGGINSVHNPSTYTHYDVNYGELALLQPATRDGYYFRGWYRDPEYTKGFDSIDCRMTGDITLYAKWESMVPHTEYKIEYVLYGGTNNELNPTSYNHSDAGDLKPITLQTPNYDGFTFGGWYTDADYVNGINEISCSAEGDITLYAKWESKNPTLRFNYVLDGGTNSDMNPGIVKTETGRSYDYRIFAPTKKGYTFKGWFQTRYGNDPDKFDYSGKLPLGVDKESYMYNYTSGGQNDTITLYAVWLPINYTIRYAKGSFNTTYEDCFVFPAANREGYYAKYGLDLDTYNEYIEGTTITVLKLLESSEYTGTTLFLDTNYYPITYNITYDCNGGSSTGEMPKTWNCENRENWDGFIPEPIKKGYMFNGWSVNDNKEDSNTLMNLSELVYNEDMFFNYTDEYRSPNISVKLYAMWEPIRYIINLEDPTGRINNQRLNIDYDQKQILGENNLIVKGYKLVKWSDQKTGDSGTEYAAGSEIINLTDVYGKQFTFYARWEAQTYKILYELDGGINNVNAPTQYTTGKGTSTIPLPTKIGYTFKGWYTDSQFQSKVTRISTELYNDITLYALWQPNNYSVAFNKNGASATGSIDMIEMTYDQEYTLPNNTFERPGYVFLGWNTTATGKGDTYTPGQKVKNLTNRANTSVVLYCMWSANTNKIAYELNGGTNDERNVDTYTTGNLIYLYSPTRTGYSFDGWYTETEFNNEITSISTSTYGDLTLYAKWSPINYSISFYKNASSATGTMDKVPAKYDEEIIAPECKFTYFGHRFTGWNTSANGSGTVYNPGDPIKNLTTSSGRNVTLYAQWKSNDYEITYELDGGTNNSKNPATYKGGASVKLYDPTKAGYVFGGWYAEPEFKNKITTISKVNDDITIYAKWNDIQFNVVYNANGGTGKMNKISNVTVKTLKLSKNAYTRKGYTFAGWNTSKKGDGIAFSDEQSAFNEFPTVKNKGTVTLYAQWYTPTYNISYELNGGTNNSANPETYNVTKDVTLKNPTRTGYTFKGWYTDSSFKTKVTKVAKATGSDITLYAKWQANAFTVKFNANGGKGKMASVKGTAPESLTLSKNTFTRAGYTFAGWNTDKKGNGTAYTDGDAIEMPNAKNGASITLYAQWYTPTYTISYELNGGENNNANPETYNVTKDVILKNPTRQGYTFLGWYKDAAYKTKVTKVVKTTGSDITLYAKWQANAFKVSFNANGGKGKMSPAKGTAPESLILPTNSFTRAGYTFAGWNTDKKGNGTAYADGDTIELPNAKNGSTLTLYAQWYTPTYTITYELDGGENNTANPETYNVLKNVSLKNPTKPGYTFLGWYKDTSYKTKITKIAKTTGRDITIYAKWQVNSFTVKFNANGGKGKMTSVKGTASELLTLPANTFTRSGYAFTGWNTNKKGTGTSYSDEEAADFINAKNKSTITLYAQWEKAQ